jgi:hypothetical protein
VERRTAARFARCCGARSITTARAPRSVTVADTVSGA